MKGCFTIRALVSFLAITALVTHSVGPATAQRPLETRSNIDGSKTSIYADDRYGRDGTKSEVTEADGSRVVLRVWRNAKGVILEEEITTYRIQKPSLDPTGNEKTVVTRYFNPLQGGGKRLGKETTTKTDITGTEYYNEAKILDDKGVQVDGSKTEKDPAGDAKSYLWDPQRKEYVKVARSISSGTPSGPPSTSAAKGFEVAGEISGGPNIAAPRESLRPIQFVSELGKTMVHLPYDMAAGDTISGTVSIVPAGQGETSQAQNAELLNDQLLDLAGQRIRVGNQRFKWIVPSSADGREISLLLRGKDQREIARAPVAVTSWRPAPPDAFEFPNLIERGRPFEIRGPFDGDFANTRLAIGGAEVVPLAESPGKLVVRSTSGSSGVGSIKCDERGLVSQGQVRTIAVRLTAPKLKLLRGEQTTLSVLVTGLKGINEAAPFTLVNESANVVSMSGGDRQDFTITPKEQAASDNFSIQRTLTGITPGAFTISARLDARLYDVWLKEVPDAERWFDEATDSFRRGRRLADEASDAGNRGENFAAAELAAEALRQLARARTYARRAVEAGEISERTAKSLEEYISSFETQARRAKDAPPREITAAPSPTPDPFSRPSPTPTAVVTEGRFEPTQGVWQDDEYFEDKPGKRLTRTGPASRDAELKMVVGRRTVLSGIREDRRARIFIRGTTNGTRLTPVKFRFTLIQNEKRKVVYDQERAENSVPLDGPVGPTEPFEASLLSGKGIPENRSFSIDQPGNYRIECELVRKDGSPTGLKVTVRGEAVETRAPKFRVVPVLLSDPLHQFFELEKEAARVAGIVYQLEDFLPVKPYSIEASATAFHDLRSLEPGFLSSFLSTTKTLQQTRRDSLVAAIGQRFGTASSLTGGEKIAVLLSKKDFALTEDSERAFAYAVSQKVFIIQPDTDHFTFAHEFIHTTPFAWADEAMVRECGRNYHNRADDNYGNGVSIRSYGGAVRRDRVPAIMGATYEYNQWITQCSYWHLLNYLVGTPDPDLLLVRGYLARGEQGVAGEFDKFYELRGESELAAGRRAGDGLAIVLRDNAGGVLAEYPFTPVWKIPDIERERTVIPFTFRVETFPALHRVELVGPAGVLDSKTLSVNRPVVKILTPGSNEVVRPAANGLSVTWTATDADRDELSYSVYYSPDGGRQWRLVSYEQTGTSFVIPVRGRPREARVRVIATDGARSSTDEIGFSFER